MARHRGQGALEVPQSEALIYRQAFDLVEHRGMSRIRVPPVDSAGTNHVDRRLLREHRPDLDRRSVGPQDEPLVQKEGVLHTPRRVARWDVQSGEVVIVGLNFGALGDPVPQATKKSTTSSMTRIEGWRLPLGYGTPGS